MAALTPPAAGAAATGAAAGATAAGAATAAWAATGAAAAAAVTAAGLAAGASTTGAGFSMTGAATEATAGRSKLMVAVERAVTTLVGASEAVSATVAGLASRWTGASAACAATEPVRTSPEAAAITAAWRPAPEALLATALEMEMNGLGRTLSALRRPRRMREDMKEPLPMPARLAVGFGWESPGHCPPLFSGSFVTSPQGTLESGPKWVPRLCRRFVCERIPDCGRARQSGRKCPLRGTGTGTTVRDDPVEVTFK